MNNIAHNLEVINNRIADAAKGKDVTLVAVSKTKPAEDIIAAYEAGQRIFGENKVQELKGKIDELSHLDIDWHLIGKLQSNKVKYIDDSIAMVQSIDSVKLLEELVKRKETRTKVLIQINIGEEEQKNGFLLENFEKSVEKLQIFDTIDILGLMCIPPVGECPEKYFLKMSELFQRLKESTLPEMKYLSMGMSGDFETAIRCGSNMVRVGSSIFGPRL